jgi:hypothetical protein
MTNIAHAMPCGYFLRFLRFMRNLSVDSLDMEYAVGSNQ